MSDELLGMLALVIVGFFLLIAIIGLLKPYFRRYTGKTESLKKQDEQMALLKEQNELMKKIIEKKG